MTEAVNMMGLLLAAALGGAAAAMAGRWMLAARVSWRNWVAWLVITGMAWGGLVLMAAAWQPVHLLVGEHARSELWLWLGACLLGAMWLSTLAVWAGGVDRLSHHHATDAGQAMTHFAKMAVPSILIAMVLWWVMPLLVGRAMTGVLAGLMAGLALVALLAVMGLHAMALAGAAAMPAEAGHRRWLWVIVGVFLLPVQAGVSFVLYCLTMLSLGRTGQPMMAALGLGGQDVSIAAMAWRWMWLNPLVVLTTAGAAAFIFKGMAAPARSLRNVASRLGPISWRKAGDSAAAAAPQQVFADLHQHLPTSPQTSPLAVEASPAVTMQAVEAEAEAAPVAPAAALAPSSTTADSHQAHWLERLGGVFPTRGHYALLAVLVGVFMFYASLVPMEYRPLAWDEAVRRFSHIRFYKLGIDRRADLLANLVLMVPVTYLMMAALCHFTTRWWGRLLAVAGVLATATAYVLAIEFAQEWFPPRTISVNDIQAGLAGAAAGVALWLATGDYVTYIIKQTYARRGSAIALQQVLLLGIVGMMVYSLFPMDFSFDASVLAKKYREGRLVLIPFLQGHDSWYWTLALMLRDMAMFVPVGLLLASLGRTMGRRVTALRAWAVIIGLAVLLELMRLPVFSAQQGLEHVIARILGGWLTWRQAHWLLDEQGRLAVGASLSRSTRLRGGVVASVVLAGLAAAALLYPFEFNGGSALFKAKMSHFINWPFQLYYYAGEWSALNKVVVCMALFAGCGFVMRWAWPDGRRAWRGLACTLVLVAAVGMGVELGHAASGQRRVFAQNLDQGLGIGFGEQAIDVTDLSISKGMVFSVGKVADVTDLLAYLAGAWAGWAVGSLMIHQPSSGRLPGKRDS